LKRPETTLKIPEAAATPAELGGSAATRTAKL
jgi:hypothetical protein